MEKLKYVLLLFFAGTSFFAADAQESDFIRKGLLRSQLTLSPAYRFSDHRTVFYLQGSLEGYLSSKVSVAGEAYYSMGAIKGTPDIFKYNHNIFFGASWHFTHNRSDLFLGVQPGISITKLDEKQSHFSSTRTGINPLVSSVAGYNYYVNNIFHFFIHTRFVYGEHNYDAHESLTEMRVSAGLGFNLNTMNSGDE